MFLVNKLSIVWSPAIGLPITKILKYSYTATFITKKQGLAFDEKALVGMVCNKKAYEKPHTPKDVRKYKIA